MNTRTRMTHSFFLSLTAATALLGTTVLAGCGGAGEPTAGQTANDEATAQTAAALGVGPTMIADASGVVTGLKSSTGNLYYTSVNGGSDIVGPNPSVFRTGKTSTPGSEILLYEELAGVGSPTYFGSITWALVGADYYAYFVTNYGVQGSGGYSQIKRIPLTGSSTATVLNTSPVELSYIGYNDLETDGTSLYWTDANGLEKMPIGGGAVATIVAGSVGPRLSLSGSSVYFSEGAGIYEFYRQRLMNYVLHVAATPATVTSLYYDAPSNTLYWGDSGGGVRRAVALLGSTQFTFQAPTTGHSIPDVGFDGTNVLWLDCNLDTSPPGNGCNVQSYTGGTLTTVQQYSNGSPTLQWDSTSMYWGDGPLYGYVH